MISVHPHDAETGFAATITGVNIVDGVPDAEFALLRDALDEYAVLVLRDQEHDGVIAGEEAQLRFARQFGPLDESYMPKAANRPGATPGGLNYGEVSNIQADGKVWDEGDRRRWFLMANFMWHSDTSYKRIPTWVTLLTSHETPPEGGDTEFADMRRAWDDLPQAMKDKVEGLQAEHSIFHSRGQIGFTDFTDEDRAAAPPVVQPLVRTHPRTGRRSLYLSSHASHIIGWPEEDGRALLQELTDFATQPKYVFAHGWRPADVVLWDNGGTMHRATPFPEFKYRRVLKRTSVNELRPLVA